MLLWLAFWFAFFLKKYVYWFREEERETQKNINVKEKYQLVAFWYPDQELKLQPRCALQLGSEPDLLSWIAEKQVKFWGEAKRCIQL